jgi:hypothetical protein
MGPHLEEGASSLSVDVSRRKDTPEFGVTNTKKLERLRKRYFEPLGARLTKILLGREVSRKMNCSQSLIMAFGNGLEIPLV